MSPVGVWQEWETEVERLLPEVGRWQQRALALFSLGIASVRHCSLAQVAAGVPEAATVPSVTRRFERLVANQNLDVTQARGAIGRAVLSQAAGRTVWLALDATPQGHTASGPRLEMLALRLLYHERAIPLAWVCYRPGQAPAPVAQLIATLIDEVAALVPSSTQVVLMTDRGLSWPSLIDQCRQVGWSFLLRVQGQTRVQTADGRIQSIRDLTPRPGTRWQGTGCAFKDAGWRDLNVVAVWRRGTTQPWLLVTDLTPTWRLTTAYRHRMDEEESFRDDKTSGFDWDASRIRDPAHMDRLLLVLQLAVCFILAQGTFVLQHGLRHILERPDRRSLSIFSLGLRWFDRLRALLLPLYPHLHLTFP